MYTTLFYRQLLKNANYNKWKKILDDTKYISKLSVVSSTILTLVTQNDFYIPIGTLAFLLYRELVIKKPELYTAEINEMYDMYNNVIKEYAKLNSELELTNPLAISTVLSKAIFDGYLSVNKSFEYSTKNHNDINRFWGNDVIKGTGCCRHIASLLNDVLHESEIKSYTLPVIYKECKINFNQEKMLEFLNSIDCDISDNIKYQSIFEEIELAPKLTPIQKSVGNHLITLAEYNDEIYYLDPTNQTFFESNTYGISNYKDSHIEINLSFIKNRNKRREIKHTLKKNCASYNDNLLIEINATKKYENNLDLFEQFYLNNHDTYETISEKVKKLI